MNAGLNFYVPLLPLEMWTQHKHFMRGPRASSPYVTSCHLPSSVWSLYSAVCCGDIKRGDVAHANTYPESPCVSNPRVLK